MPLFSLVSLVSSFTTVAGWLLGFGCWFLIWAPLIALLEYATHRWIMHTTNWVLDPRRTQLQAHTKHHQGGNDHDLVDMPVKNCLILTGPIIVLVVLYGLIWQRLASVVMPCVALFAWSFVYSYLWTQIHRAIHNVQRNWFRRSGFVFRFFRNHHLNHHTHPRTNYGTVFPWTDYLFFTWVEQKPRPSATARRRRKKQPNAARAT